MHRIHNPPTAGKPGPTYSQGVEVESGCRVLHISGQIGVDANGYLGATTLEQVQIAFRNIKAILESAGMTVAQLVRIRSFLVDPADASVFRQARDEFLRGVTPASSTLIVNALLDPNWRVEVEAIAASREAVGDGGN